MPKGYPPNRRDRLDVQPEVCDVCGLLVGGRHLREQDVRGLRGKMVCQYHDWRGKDDDPDDLPDMPGQKIGNSRVYPPGDEPWFYTEEGNS